MAIATQSQGDGRRWQHIDHNRLGSLGGVPDYVYRTGRHREGLPIRQATRIELPGEAPGMFGWIQVGLTALTGDRDLHIRDAASVGDQVTCENHP